MPLPDASKKSPRVYTNLQNLDLDNVTFANVQSTGNPIAVEEMNEDEMRRLVLVNLARLVCAGEWTGLLEAGSGGGGSVLGVGAGVKSGAVYSTISKQAPFGRGEPDTTMTWNSDAVFYIPVIAPLTATMDQVTLRITTASSGGDGDMLVALYNSDEDTGAPTTQASDEATVDGSSTGFISVDFSSPPDLEVGKLYYFGMARTLDNVSFEAHLTENETNFGGQEYASGSNRNMLTETGVDNSLPATATAANILGATYACPSIMVKWSTT